MKKIFTSIIILSISCLSLLAQTDTLVNRFIYADFGNSTNKVDSENRKQGYHYEYDENGNLISKRFYVDDKVHGHGESYYSNGTLERLTVFDFGNIVYQVCYHPNGTIEKYIECSDLGRLYFIQYFLENGNIERHFFTEIGEPRFSVMINPNGEIIGGTGGLEDPPK